LFAFLPPSPTPSHSLSHSPSSFSRLLHHLLLRTLGSTLGHRPGEHCKHRGGYLLGSGEPPIATAICPHARRQAHRSSEASNRRRQLESDAEPSFDGRRGNHGQVFIVCLGSRNGSIMFYLCRPSHFVMFPV
jgi:hypothetical protein